MNFKKVFHFHTNKLHDECMKVKICENTDNSERVLKLLKDSSGIISTADFTKLDIDNQNLV